MQIDRAPRLLERNRVEGLRLGETLRYRVQDCRAIRSTGDGRQAVAAARHAVFDAVDDEHRAREGRHRCRGRDIAEREQLAHCVGLLGALGVEEDGRVDAGQVEVGVLVSEVVGPGEVAGGKVLRGRGRRVRGGAREAGCEVQETGEEQVGFLGGCEVDGEGGEESGQCGEGRAGSYDGVRGEAGAEAQGLI